VNVKMDKELFDQQVQELLNIVNKILVATSQDQGKHSTNTVLIS